MVKTGGTAVDHIVDRWQLAACQDHIMMIVYWYYMPKLKYTQLAHVKTHISEILEGLHNKHCNVKNQQTA